MKRNERKGSFASLYLILAPLREIKMYSREKNAEGSDTTAAK
jgi:hypothetical protein